MAEDGKKFVGEMKSTAVTVSMEPHRTEESMHNFKRIVDFILKNIKLDL